MGHWVCLNTRPFHKAVTLKSAIQSLTLPLVPPILHPHMCRYGNNLSNNMDYKHSQGHARYKHSKGEFFSSDKKPSLLASISCCTSAHT